MQNDSWQKSSYSAQGNNCLEISVACEGEVRLRESDEPGVVLTAPAVHLRTLLRIAKAGALSVR